MIELAGEHGDRARIAARAAGTADGQMRGRGLRDGTGDAESAIARRRPRCSAPAVPRRRHPR